jgi:hypothetical protein
MSKKNQKLVARKEPEVTESETTKTETTATETKTEATATEKPAKAKKEKAPKAPKEPKPKKEKPARETLAHMAKVDKYAASLPTLSESAQAVFTQAESLSSGELNVLSAHISLLARKRATASASNVKLREGDRVRIHSGIDTRFIGKEGVVTRCQRIRIFVRVPGFSKDAYLFASNVERLEAEKIDVSDDAPESTGAKTATG